MNEAMIKITDLRKSYGNLDVLKGIDLTIAEREVVVIIGPSGSGKSTFTALYKLFGRTDRRQYSY